MRKIILVIIIVSYCVSIRAQHEVKVNLAGLPITNFAVAYEYNINPQSGINIIGSYFRTPGFINTILETKYTSRSITGEYRFYFFPNDNNGSGLWLAPYVKYNRKEFKNIRFSAQIDTFGTFSVGPYDITSSKIAMGLSLGYKFVVNHLSIEPYLGYGRNVVIRRQFSPEITSPIDVEKIPIVKERIENILRSATSIGLIKSQLRGGFNIGYRFGFDTRSYYR